MPNWSCDILKIEGPRDELKRFIKESQSIPDYYFKYEWAEEDRRGNPYFSFSGIYPIPEDVLRDWYINKPLLKRRWARRSGKWRNRLIRLLTGRHHTLRNRLWTNLIHAQGKATTADIQRKTEGWYYWALAHWGTKWDVDSTSHVVDNSNLQKPSVQIEFLTAWSPPLGWLAVAAKRFPALMFTLDYEEPGMCFAGKAVAKRGRIIHDECHNMDALELRERHPDWEWDDEKGASE